MESKLDFLPFMTWSFEWIKIILFHHSSSLQTSLLMSLQSFDRRSWWCLSSNFRLWCWSLPRASSWLGLLALSDAGFLPPILKIGNLLLNRIRFDMKGSSSQSLKFRDFLQSSYVWPCTSQQLMVLPYFPHLLTHQAFLTQIDSLIKLPPSMLQTTLCHTYCSSQLMSQRWWFCSVHLWWSESFAVQAASALQSTSSFSLCTLPNDHLLFLSNASTQHTFPLKF